MAAPDIGLAPPPPVDVASQMRPGGSGAGAPDLAGLIAQLTGGQAPQIGPDITPKVIDVAPILTALARQVPAIGPDVDRLIVELKAHMAGLPNILSQMGGGSGGPGPSIGPNGAAGPQGPPDLAAVPSGAAAAPAAPPVPPNPAQDMGAMDLAMQIEVKLPSIGKDDPTLMPYIQGFIARMRQEVPKVVQGDTEPVSPPTQAAPTESMLSKVPVAF